MIEAENKEMKSHCINYHHFNIIHSRFHQSSYVWTIIITRTHNIVKLPFNERISNQILGGKVITVEGSVSLTRGLDFNPMNPSVDSVVFAFYTRKRWMACEKRIYIIDYLSTEVQFLSHL